MLRLWIDWYTLTSNKCEYIFEVYCFINMSKVGREYFEIFLTISSVTLAVFVSQTKTKSVILIWDANYKEQ